MKAREVVSYIEEFAPLHLQESWDNAGFCIGDPDKEVSSVLLALDCTKALLDEAVAIGADMIITHHPLIFSGVKKINPAIGIGRTIQTAIKNDIVIYSAHTNIDKVIRGVSGKMAERLGLIDICVLDSDLEEGTGLGVIGDLPFPIQPAEFVEKVKSAFSLKTLRCSELLSKPISRVALCGGSGKSLIMKAVHAGADVFVSGDISYHDFFCNPDFMIMDIGHFESEIDIVKTIYDILRENLPTFAVRIGTQNNNPVYYF